jgi:plasmid stabilization system protein ParE
VDFHLIYSKEALAELAAILDEISANDPGAASRFGISLLDHISLLKLFPDMGALVPDRVRVRKLTHTPIVVYYVANVNRRVIEVLHLRHGARSEPEHL